MRSGGAGVGVGGVFVVARMTDIGWSKIFGCPEFFGWSVSGCICLCLCCRGGEVKVREALKGEGSESLLSKKVGQDRHFSPT